MSSDPITKIEQQYKKQLSKCVKESCVLSWSKKNTGLNPNGSNDSMLYNVNDDDDGTIVNVMNLNIVISTKISSSTST